MRSILILLVIMLGACKAGIQDMSGGSGKKSKSAEKSGVTGKEESLAYGNETTSKTDAGTEDTEGEEVGQADPDQAIPPESIAGAFLACDFAAEAATPTEVVYACAVFNDTSRITMKGIKQLWRLTTTEGVTVESKDYPIDPTADKAWVIARTISQAGFVAELTLVDALGETHVIKTKCGCTVSTPI